MILDIPGVSERRQSPRHVVDLPADLILESGEVITINTRDISSGGLQIRCDAWVTEMIEPRGIQNHATCQIRFKLIMDLPIKDTVEKLYANCRIMSVQRLSQEVYILNLAFIDFENNTGKTLNKFLDQFQQKKIVVNAITA